MRYVALFSGIIVAGVIAVAVLVFVIVQAVFNTGLPIVPTNVPTDVPIVVSTGTPVFCPISPSLTPSFVPTFVPVDVPDPTPTREFACVPDSYAMVSQLANIFLGPDLSAPHGVVRKGEYVLLLLGETVQARHVVTAEGPKIRGWIAKWVLPPDCR